MSSIIFVFKLIDDFVKDILKDFYKGQSLMETYRMAYMSEVFHDLKMEFKNISPPIQIALKEIEEVIKVIQNDKKDNVILRFTFPNLQKKIQNLVSELKLYNYDLVIQSDRCMKCHNINNDIVNYIIKVNEKYSNFLKEINVLSTHEFLLPEIYDIDCSLNKEIQSFGNLGNKFEFVNILELLDRKLELIMQLKFSDKQDKTDSVVEQCNNNATEVNEVEKINNLNQRVKELEADKLELILGRENLTKKLTELESRVSDMNTDLESQIDEGFKLQHEINLMRNSDSDNIQSLTNFITKLGVEQSEISSVSKLINIVLRYCDENIINKSIVPKESVSEDKDDLRDTVRFDETELELQNSKGKSITEMVCRTELENLQYEFDIEKSNNIFVLEEKTLEIDYLKSELGKLEENMKNVQELHIRDKEEIDSLEELILSIKLENEELLRTKEIQSNELEKAVEDFLKLSEEFDQLKSLLDSREEEWKQRTNNQEIVNELVEKINELNGKLLTSEKNLEELKCETDKEIYYHITLTESKEKEIEDLNIDLHNLEKLHTEKCDENDRNFNQLQATVGVLAEIQATVESQDNLMSTVKVENENLRKINSDQSNELEKAVEDFLKLSEEFDHIKERLERKEEEVDLLTNEFQQNLNDVKTAELELARKCKELEKENLEHKESILELSRRIGSYEEENIEIKTAKMELENRIQEQKRKLEIINKQIQDNELMVENLDREHRERIDQLNAILNEKCLVIENVVKENEELNWKIGELNTLLKINETSIDNFKAELVEKEQFTQEVLKTSELYNQELKVMQEKMIEFESIKCELLKVDLEIENSREELRKKESEIELIKIEAKNSCNQKIDNINILHAKDIDSLQRELSAAVDELNQMKFQRKPNQNEDFEKLKLEFEAMKQELAKSDQKHKSITSLLRELETENKIWRDKVFTSNEELKRLKVKSSKEISNLKSKIDSLETQMGASNENSVLMTKLEEEIDNLKSNLKLKNEETVNLKEECEKLKQEMGSFESLIHHFTDLKTRYRQKRTLIEELQKKVRELEEDNQNLQKGSK